MAKNNIEIISINDCLRKDISIPKYQRPYKWGVQNIGSFPRWEDDGAGGVNRFGNLCLVQRNVNSKFSNMHPSAKKSTFQEMISKGSLKLRIMSEITTEDSRLWRDETCSKHEAEMLNLLKQACGQ